MAGLRHILVDLLVCMGYKLFYFVGPQRLGPMIE